jgi:hypothetical protein
LVEHASQQVGTIAFAVGVAGTACEDADRGFDIGETSAADVELQ